jgi:hypothetical protein
VYGTAAHSCSQHDWQGNHEVSSGPCISHLITLQLFSDMGH